MDYKKHGVKATNQEFDKITKKGDKMTKQQFNKINKKPSFSKRHKPFIEGANVIVPNLDKSFDFDKPFVTQREGEVVSYDSFRKSYQIKLDNGSIVIYPENHVKGWWE